MNDLELKVINYENRDVITTSLCPYIKTNDHIYINELNCNQETGDDVTFYRSIGEDKLVEGPSIFIDIQGDFPEINSVGWWHYDEENEKYIKCNDDNEHPFDQQLLR